MLAVFCLRLAAGLSAALLLLSPAQVNPRFYRVHFLTVLGLAAVALAVGGELVAGWPAVVLGGGLLFAFLGSVSWWLARAPGGRLLIVLTTAALAVALCLVELRNEPEVQPFWLLAGSLSSAALLGAAMTAMLMGHSYLIAPAMSLTPLYRLLAALLAATALRLLVAGVGLWSWTAGHSLFNLEDETVLWLPIRWGLGFVGPLALGVLAWQCARLRSTQSATGILYVVVIFCFLGELTSQLLLGNTRYLL